VFKENCELLPEPGAPPPTDWTLLCQATASSTDDASIWIPAPCTLPDITKDVRFELVSNSGPLADMHVGWIKPALTAPVATNWGESPGGSQFVHTGPVLSTQWPWQTLNFEGAVDAFPGMGAVFHLRGPSGSTITARWLYRPRTAQPTPYPGAEDLAEPPTVPTAAGCPDTPDTQAVGNYLCELHHKVDALDRKLDDLLNSNVPPEYTADESPYDVTDPTAPIEKPSTAIGIAIALSTPAGLSRYGVNPGAGTGAGFVTLGTDDGWLPSTPLKHNPQLILPLPFQVARIGLDLAPGVTATYKWLWPGKPLG
jgi:hypothetical protein